MRLITTLTVAAVLASPAAEAAVIYADEILDYYHSGSETFAEGYGYGGPPDASEVLLTNATDQSTSTYVSLPTDSYISLGFSTGYIFDGAGDDLFVDEIGSGGEDAELYVSTDYGASFTLLTTVFGNQTNSLDFADYSFAGRVNAVKLVGLDNGGSSPGFDVTGVWGLEGSTVEEPQTPAVPLPAGLPLLVGGLGLLAMKSSQRRIR